MAIGAAVRMATLIVPADVRSLLSVIERAIDIASTVANAPHSHSGPGMRNPRAALAFQPLTVATVMEPAPDCERRGASRGAANSGLRGRGTHERRRHTLAPSGSGGAIGGGAGAVGIGVRRAIARVSASSALRRTTS